MEKYKPTLIVNKGFQIKHFKRHFAFETFKIMTEIPNNL